MTFWDRYEKLCLAAGYKPGSEQAAQVLGTNRGTISAWKKSGNPPTPDILVRIADAYGVSSDYLLCRTDDETDYSNPDLLAELAGPQLDALGGDAKKAVALQRATAEDARREATPPKGVQLYMQLDKLDRGKAEGYMQGLLSQDKYIVQPVSRKKQALSG